MEVLAQGFAIRALVLPQSAVSIVDGMVLLAWGMVLTKTNVVLLSGGLRWRFWHKVLLLELWFCLSLLQVEHRRGHGFAFLGYGFDQNQSGFAVCGLAMEVLVQGFAIRALVLPQSAS